MVSLVRVSTTHPHQKYEIWWRSDRSTKYTVPTPLTPHETGEEDLSETKKKIRCQALEKEKKATKTFYTTNMPYKLGSGRGMENLLLLTDSYKVSHHVQYPKGTTTIYSYFESRGGRHREVCFFGLQYFIKRYLTGVVVTKEKIDEAAAMYSAHFGPGTNVFNREGTYSFVSSSIYYTHSSYFT